MVQSLAQANRLRQSILKMADEQTKPPFNKPSTIPAELDWQSLLSKEGDALEVHYRHILETLGKGRGMLGVIFRKSRNKIQDPAKLRLLIDLINGETWVGIDIDIKGDIYEGLLQKKCRRYKKRRRTVFYTKTSY